MPQFKKTVNVGGESIDLPVNFSPKWLGLGALGLLVIILLFSSFFSVGPDEQGVVQRFGKYVRTEESGLHVKIPFGIETVQKVKVRFVFKEEFGFRTLKSGVRSVYSDRDFQEESLMLTGDLNLAEMEWIVQYRIDDPKAYLFNVREVNQTIRDISESVVREVVGDRSVTGVLTTGRMEVADEVQQKLQNVLDSYDIGIKIGTLKLQDVNPPDVVKPAFNEVNESKQEKERMINQAWEAYNQQIPRAKGEAKQLIEAAEGYKLKRVNRAQGDADNFRKVWNAYRQSKDVTRRRLYLETMQEVLPKVEKKYILDEAQNNVLPFLPLREGGAQ